MRLYYLVVLNSEGFSCTLDCFLLGTPGRSGGGCKLLKLHARLLQDRKQDVVFGNAGTTLVPPNAGMRFPPALRIEDAQHRDFVAGLKLGAPQAVLPGFQWQFPAFDFDESEFFEEPRNVGENEHGIET